MAGDWFLQKLQHEKKTEQKKAGPEGPVAYSYYLRYRHNIFSFFSAKTYCELFGYYSTVNETDITHDGFLCLVDINQTDCPRISELACVYYN